MFEQIDGPVYAPRTPTADGKKQDVDKTPLMEGCLAYFPRALNAVAYVSAYGSGKYNVGYADKNWERVPTAIVRYTNALARHLVAEGVDGAFDPESRLRHAAHLAWNALARLELILKPTPQSAINQAISQHQEHAAAAVDAHAARAEKRQMGPWDAWRPLGTS